MVKKITLSSSLDIEEFPKFNLLDFHKKHDLIKNYKDRLLEIRKEYNTNICKLPEQLSLCREEYKLVNDVLAGFDNFKTTKV